MTTLVRFEPFRELATLQSEMSRLLGTFAGGNGVTETRGWVPAVDVWETGDELVYAVDLPGVPEDEISVEFEDGALIISGERALPTETSQERFYRFERRFGGFSRTIALPQGVTDESIQADYKDGVLEVHVQKPEQPKPRRIEIGSKTIEGSAETS
jgi:HSP20 family protein